MYPWKKQKTFTSDYKILTDDNIAYIMDFYMQRSTMCLEKSPFSGLNIPP